MIPPAVPQGAEEPKAPIYRADANFELAHPGTARYIVELREYAESLRVRCDQQERKLRWIANEPFDPAEAPGAWARRLQAAALSLVEAEGGE